MERIFCQGNIFGGFRSTSIYFILAFLFWNVILRQKLFEVRNKVCLTFHFFAFFTFYILDNGKDATNFSKSVIKKANRELFCPKKTNKWKYFRQIIFQKGSLQLDSSRLKCQHNFLSKEIVFYRFPTPFRDPNQRVCHVIKLRLWSTQFLKWWIGKSLLQRFHLYYLLRRQRQSRDASQTLNQSDRFDKPVAAH